MVGVEAESSPDSHVHDQKEKVQTNLNSERIQGFDFDPQSDPLKKQSYTTFVVLGVPHGLVSR
jgi:hypothetical protein